jgi:transcriptional regulator with XRE-family HTH domain
MEKFGVFLRELRNGNNFSLREFAIKIGMTPSYLSDIEQGKRNAPKKDYLDRMIKELNLKNEEVKIFYDLARKGKIVPIAEDVKEIIIKNKNIPVLCRQIKEKNIDVEELIKDIEKGKK